MMNFRLSILFFNELALADISVRVLCSFVLLQLPFLLKTLLESIDMQDTPLESLVGKPLLY